jgi:hypothetical protein
MGCHHHMGSASTHYIERVTDGFGIGNTSVFEEINNAVSA